MIGGAVIEARVRKSTAAAIEGSRLRRRPSPEFGRAVRLGAIRRIHPARGWLIVVATLVASAATASRGVVGFENVILDVFSRRVPADRGQCRATD